MGDAVGKKIEGWIGTRYAGDGGVRMKKTHLLKLTHASYFSSGVSRVQVRSFCSFPGKLQRVSCKTLNTVSLMSSYVDDEPYTL